MPLPHTDGSQGAIERLPGHWGLKVIASWLRQNLVQSLLRHVSALVKRRDCLPVRIGSGLSAARIVLVMCVKNERDRLEYHLDYYRRLGVEHFLVVDNESTDGTLEYLAQFDEVSTYRARGSFAKARFGTDWVNGVLHRHCVGKWVIWVDADELLVFGRDEKASLGDLTRRLRLEGRRSLQTIMLDMYSDRPPSRNTLKPGQDPLEVCDLFDRWGYEQKFGRDNHTSWIKGGVRCRLFFHRMSESPALNKTPLVHWRRHHVFMKVGHQLWPGGLNGNTRVGGALLHFKFTDMAASKIADQTYRVEHTSEYDAYNDLDAVTFRGAATTRFSGVDQLESLGLLHPFV